jgi:hypothetical protein
MGLTRVRSAVLDHLFGYLGVTGRRHPEHCHTIPLDEALITVCIFLHTVKVLLTIQLYNEMKGFNVKINGYQIL